MRVRRGLVARCVMVTVALAASAAPASAVFPGENGRVVYVSGRGGTANDDSGADVYVQDTPGTEGVALDTRSGQHRHPSWSPDLKRIAYALWDGSNNEKIWVHPVAGGTPERLGPNASNVRDDRPSWSPDGTRIAYESEVTDGSGQMDILVTDISDSITGPTVNLTQTANAIEGKPVWSPDGRWIYFSRRALPPATDDDILRVRSDGTSAFPEFVVNSATAEYQAGLSPDGKRICYTRGAFGSAAADVYVMEIGGAAPGVDLSNTSAGAYNCVFSPDGKQVAYAVGLFSGASLVVIPATGGTPELLAPDTPNHFDGNPDWAPKRPPFCGGLPATKVGTDGRNTLVGTSGRDVIQGFGGNDTIKGLGGNDVLCGGNGNDRLEGGTGNDLHLGGPGRDTCIGGPGRDRGKSCER